MEQSLRKLGVEKLSKEDVQRMQWEALEAKIGNWIHFMRIAVRVYTILYMICKLFLLIFHLFFTMLSHIENRSNCCLLGKRKSAIKFLKELIL